MTGLSRDALAALISDHKLQISSEMDIVKVSAPCSQAWTLLSTEACSHVWHSILQLIRHEGHAMSLSEWDMPA